MKSEQIIRKFNEGVAFVNQEGRRIVAVAEHEVGPALICGTDDDTLAVKLEGVDYYSPTDRSDDFWDVVVATDLQEVV